MKNKKQTEVKIGGIKDKIKVSVVGGVAKPRPTQNTEKKEA